MPIAIGIAIIGGRKETTLHTIMGLLSVCWVIIMFAFPAILRHIWKKQEIAEKLALLEMAGATDPHAASLWKKQVAKMCSVMLVSWAFMALCIGIEYLRPVIYDFRMEHAYSDGDYSESRGDKCTVYLVDEDLYTSDPLPVRMYTNSPRQVGYILRIRETPQLKSYITDYNIFTYESKQIPAYIYVCTVEWIECKSGTIVHTQTIEGNRPYRGDPMIDGVYYGRKVIGSWSFDEAIEEAYDMLTG